MPGERAGAVSQRATAAPVRAPVTELHMDRVGMVRVALDPYVSVLALATDALGRRRGAPPAWRTRILAALAPRSAGALLPVTAPRYSIIPECIDPLNPVCEIAIGDQLDRLHAIPGDEVAGAIHAVFGPVPPPHWQNALRQPRGWIAAYARAMAEAWQSVEPLWARAQPLLEREVERVGVAAMRGGLGVVLDRLHPAARFHDDVLTIRDPEPGRFALGGRPLVLVPMLSGSQALICQLERPEAVWIGYPLPALSELPGFPDASRQLAGDLLESVAGPVRARILRATDRPVTMSDLARAVGLVPSALTYHCGRLAAAGLVRREQRGRQVWITRTRRGTDLMTLLREH